MMTLGDHSTESGRKFRLGNKDDGDDDMTSYFLRHAWPNFLHRADEVLRLRPILVVFADRRTSPHPKG
jgi:hypothetical protein